MPISVRILIKHHMYSNIRVPWLSLEYFKCTFVFFTDAADSESVSRELYQRLLNIKSRREAKSCRKPQNLIHSESAIRNLQSSSQTEETMIQCQKTPWQEV